MKNKLSLRSRMVRKACLIVFSFAFLAACMQYDESLAPGNAKLSSNDITIQNMGMGTPMKRTFTSHLTAANELPVNGVPVESLAQGQAIFRVSENSDTIYYKIIVANLQDATVAHIHCNAAGTNGIPFVFLFGPTAPMDVNGILSEGYFTQANLIQRQDAANCVGGLATMADVIERMQNGTSYLNVHTTRYPGGEIRGQIQ